MFEACGPTTNSSAAFFAYVTNHLIDLDHPIIVDVEPPRTVRQAEVTAARTMVERVREHHDLWPARLAADTAYGSAEMLVWLVHDQGIEPHFPVIDKSEQIDGTFSRSDFVYEHPLDLYHCRRISTCKSLHDSPCFPPPSRKVYEGLERGGWVAAVGIVEAQGR